ncbi:MAG: 2TM domain-containing protein [Cyclobacteriaceae bacterium]|jgi:hypothetical protein|nr:2TM domain-containing protein [Cyclobacteriaceae bacterium]
MNITEDQLYREARKRVKKKKKFYSHLISYLVIGTFLTFINWYTRPGHWWVQWVWLGWGIGIFFHGISLFKNNVLFGEKWEEDEIRKEMERMKRS